MDKLSTKNLKVTVSGKREWDNETQKLAKVEMTLEDFCDFVTSIDVSSADVDSDFIESEDFDKAVVGYMVLNGGKITLECCTSSYDDAITLHGLESWADSVDERHNGESFEDTFVCVLSMKGE